MLISIDPADPVSGMTTGDISRLLGVDLKTVHRWVQAGRLSGRRTDGGHLRFHRPEVVRFLRGYGYEVPRTVGDEAPRVIAVGSLGAGARQSAPPGLGRAFDVETCTTLFDAVIAASEGYFEVLALDLAQYSPTLIREFVESIRNWALTATMALLAVSPAAKRRQSFIRFGGDIAVTSPVDVRNAIKWLTGGRNQAPRGAEVQSAPLPN